MQFRAKLRVKMESADRLGIVTLNFAPIDTGMPQLSLTVAQPVAAALVVGETYAFAAVEDQYHAPA